MIGNKRESENEINKLRSSNASARIRYNVTRRWLDDLPYLILKIIAKLVLYIIKYVLFMNGYLTRLESLLLQHTAVFVH
jgi:hypothetical protein